MPKMDKSHNKKGKGRSKSRHQHDRSRHDQSAESQHSLGASEHDDDDQATQADLERQPLRRGSSGGQSQRPPQVEDDAELPHPPSDVYEDTDEDEQPR